jgi:protein-glucosylgalactosylhydroxylysine glucosidase
VTLAAGACCLLALAAGRLSAQAPDSTFLLSTSDVRRSPSPFIGNGRVGVVIPALGIGASRSLVAGLYEHGPDDVPRIAAAPAWNAIGVFDGTRWLGTESPADSSIRDYHQTVDMRTGTARTTYDWVDGARRTSVLVETFVSRAAPGLAAIRLELVPRQPGPVRVRFALAGWPPPRRLALARLERAEPGWTPADIWYSGHTLVRTRAATARPGLASLSMTSRPEGRQTTLAQVAQVTWPGNLARAAAHTTAAGETAAVEIAFDASPGQPYTFTQLVSLVSSMETARPLAVAARRVEAAGTRGYAGVAAANAAAWARRWETDIVLDGDPALQRVVRSMLFYLLCSADPGTGLGIPPMGLSSAGYYGHVFWDSDTWMFPALVLTHPDVAHSLVAFRSRTVPAARANARGNGYRGTMYPWEADELGNETTPHFAVQNARSEIHVNGDVALAQWQYYQATGDSTWLAREGFPVIRGTADFWVSRATRDSSRDVYHIRNVVSVAEGLVGVDDDAYTNAVARKNLEIAAAASARLGLPADPRWREVATKLNMPIDSATGAWRTYEGAPDSTLGVITPLLSYPLGVQMSDEAKRTHLEQAVRRLDDEAAGAMMGITLLSVDAAELGDRRLVDSLLPFSYQGHLRGPFLMLSETPTNNAVNFLTGAGGFLQQVIFGYTGLRLGDRGLEPAFPAVLPSRVSRLLIRNLHVRGRRYDVAVDSAGRRLLPHAEAAPR